MSALYYDEDSAGGDYSGWGFEFSMRVVPYAGDPARKRTVGGWPPRPASRL